MVLLDICANKHGILRTIWKVSDDNSSHLL